VVEEAKHRASRKRKRDESGDDEGGNAETGDLKKANSEEGGFAGLRGYWGEHLGRRK